MPTARILIVEDEVLIAEYLKDILYSFGFEQVQLAHTIPQVKDVIALFNPEIILLDIRMENERTGISIAEDMCRQQGIPFIYITAHSDEQTMLAALATKPAGYITKPVKKADVYAAISILMNDREQRAEKYFVFKDAHASVRLASSDILYIKSKGNYTEIATGNKKYIVRQSLGTSIEQLPKDQFIRVHRSYIVNQAKIDKSTARHVYVNGIAIPVSRNKRIHL